MLLKMELLPDTKTIGDTADKLASLLIFLFSFWQTKSIHSCHASPCMHACMQVPVRWIFLPGSPKF